MEKKQKVVSEDSRGLRGSERLRLSTEGIAFIDLSPRTNRHRRNATSSFVGTDDGITIFNLSIVLKLSSLRPKPIPFRWTIRNHNLIRISIQIALHRVHAPDPEPIPSGTKLVF